MKNPAEIKLFIASDHAGFFLKEFLLQELSTLGFKIADLGCDSAEKSIDYPDIAEKMVSEIKSDSDFGILICGSGVGISIAANRHKKIRAALCFNKEIASLARAHNNANVICFGARFIDKTEALNSVKTFFTTKFEGGRHEARVAKISR